MICEKRFAVVNVDKSLQNIEPVDLGVRHEHRLHHKLWKIARTTDLDDDGQGEYSFVLHGPPGSSKTILAQALSNEMWRTLAFFHRFHKSRLIRITPADFTRHGEDRLDSEARSIFELLSHVRGVTVFFDEIDDLLHKRTPAQELQFMELVIPAMLNRLADLRDACPHQQICFLISTNYIENIEPALLRDGRIDAVIPVVYPDVESRYAMLGKHLDQIQEEMDKLRHELSAKPDELSRLQANLWVLNEKRSYIIEHTNLWPWRTLDKLLREYSSPRNAQEHPRDIKARIEVYESHLAISSYLERLRVTTPMSQELVNEFVRYEFGHNTIAGSEESDCFENLQRISQYRSSDLAEKTQEAIEHHARQRWAESYSKKPVENELAESVSRKAA